MHIIPAIDIIDGKCVRLHRGDYNSKKVYHEHPLEVAQQFESNGIKHLHLVDLDGAKAGKIINWKILEAISTNTQLKVDFGGGLQSPEDLKIAFDSGAQQVTGGSIAVKKPEVFKSWIETYGPERIILGADVKEEKIAISGWRVITDISLFDFLEEYLALGIKYVICTDIQKDGALQGPSLELYQRIIHHFPDVQLIASGGISQKSDIEALNQAGLKGAIIGKAIYEEKITFSDLSSFL